MAQEYEKPNIIVYSLAKLAANVMSSLFFHRRMRRNELCGVKGPYVVIANHEMALDFVNLIGASSRRMTFVISKSFYNSLPLHRFFDAMHMIPKQQFQTAPGDIKKMKAVIKNGAPLVIYPAGLMCEDGISTPIPKASFKLLKWLDADVYMARSYGTYFCMPKWSSGIRAGSTEMDIYKLFSREELKSLSLEEIRERAEKALSFDAYREEERLRLPYSKIDRLEGLENVLYVCPDCSAEFTMQASESRISCLNCGYTQEGDKHGLLKLVRGKNEIRYVPEWSRAIFQKLKREIAGDEGWSLSSRVRIDMIDQKRHRFTHVGWGRLTVDRKSYRLEGVINGISRSISLASKSIPTLPFSPGKRLELQYGSEIFRCYPEDGRLAMKFINAIKAIYELEAQAPTI